MDVKATLKQWLEFQDRESAKAFNEWSGKGGFLPRVAIHPATDAWMMGVRYGTAFRIGTKYLGVRLDSGRTVQLLPKWIIEVI